MSNNSNFILQNYTDQHKTDWDLFIDECSFGNILFKRDYMEYHKDRFTDASQVILKGDKLVAIFPANVIDDVVHSHQGLSYGGLIFKESLRLNEITEILEVLLKSLEATGIQSIKWKVAPSIYRKSYTDVIQYLLFVVQAERFRSDAYLLIDMRDGYSPNRNRKRAVKKARSQGIEVREGGEMEYFWESILSKNLKDRFGVTPVHSLDEMKYLMGLFPEKIQFFTAMLGDEVKAGAVMYEMDDIAHFQYSSGEEDRAENGALDLLFHDIIERFSDKKFISFGSSSEEGGMKLNHGLVYWKESYGSIVMPQDYYEVKTNSHPKLQALRSK